MRACTAKLFQTEFEKQRFKRSRGASIFLKSVYFVNLALLLAAMISVSIKQENGDYQCDDITVDFGDNVWEEAVVERTPGQYEQKTLVFSYFNGVYMKRGTHARRPVYVEMRKFDRTDYETPFIVPAPSEIKYDTDSGAWVLTQAHIGKSKDKIGEWILRSPKTSEYDLMNVDGNWEVWIGEIGSTTVTTTCNYCNDNSDCNLNGRCGEDGTCQCYNVDGVQYLGKHCEGKLKDTCQTIVGEGQDQPFSVQYYSPDGISPADKLFQEYSRPVYAMVDPVSAGMTEDDIVWLVYSGRRWFGMNFNLKRDNMTIGDLIFGVNEFHAFWSDVYREEITYFVSNPTLKDTPVGVDWYTITDRGEQFGWLGALEPIQNYSGRGFFRCAGDYIEPYANETNSSSTRKLQLEELPRVSWTEHALES